MQHDTVIDMSVHIALFRGINVGGKHLLPMKELVAIFERLGARSVKTYIQSGNVAFALSGKDVSHFTTRVRAEIGKRYGFEPAVMALGLDDIDRVIRENPFPEGEKEPRSLHAGFLASTPERPDLGMLESLRSERERFRLLGQVFYLYAPDGIGRSKLATQAERALGVAMTDRNWRTVRALWDMARVIDAA